MDLLFRVRRRDVEERACGKTADAIGLYANMDIIVHGN